MFGLLGPNGAGKSTLMRTIATLRDPDASEIWFDEVNVLQNKDKIRQILGYLRRNSAFIQRCPRWICCITWP